MKHERESSIEQEVTIEILRKKIESLDISNEEEFREIVENIKRRTVRLNNVEFAKRKEKIRGKEQLIPSEFDLAFLDQTKFQIYLNTDNVPEEGVQEILEHEATELIHIVNATHDEKPNKEDWRKAHQAALVREYRLAQKNNRLEKHHEWTLAYLKKLKETFSENTALAETIDRQIQERAEVLLREKTV